MDQQEREVQIEQYIRNLMNIEEPYLNIERKDKLTHIPKRVGGWLAKISTKYQISFGDNHKHLALSIIMDIIEEYNIPPERIKEIIKEKELTEKGPYNRREYWRIYELLDHIQRIREKRGKSYMKSLGSYVPSILESLYRPPDDDEGGVMYHKLTPVVEARLADEEKESMRLAAARNIKKKKRRKRTKRTRRTKRKKTKRKKTKKRIKR